jgi:hypothetical protein
MVTRQIDWIGSDLVSGWDRCGCSAAGKQLLPEAAPAGQQVHGAYVFLVWLIWPELLTCSDQLGLIPNALGWPTK